MLPLVKIRPEEALQAALEECARRGWLGPRREGEDVRPKPGCARRVDRLLRTYGLRLRWNQLLGYFVVLDQGPEEELPEPDGDFQMKAREVKAVELNVRYLPLFRVSVEARRALLLEELLARGWLRAWRGALVQPQKGAWRAVASLARAYDLGVRPVNSPWSVIALEITGPRCRVSGLCLVREEFTLEVQEDGSVLARSGAFRRHYWRIPSLRTLRADKREWEEKAELERLEAAYEALCRVLPLRKVELLDTTWDTHRRLRILREVVPRFLEWGGGVAALLGR